jgi:hypothetical protein
MGDKAKIAGRATSNMGSTQDVYNAGHIFAAKVD